MASKTLDSQLQHYWPLLEKDEQRSILTFIKSFLKQKDTPQRVTIEEYNKEIDDAIKRVKSGEFYTHEQVVEMSKKW